MSVRIQYAYLKQQTWLFRRNYPKELQGLLGQAMKQSLKTGDARVARARAAEDNAKYEEVIAKAKQGQVVEKPAPVVVTPPVFSPVVIVGRRTVKELARLYLNRRSGELQHGGLQVRAVLGRAVRLSLRCKADRGNHPRRCAGFRQEGGAAWSAYREIVADSWLWSGSVGGSQRW